MSRTSTVLEILGFIIGAFAIYVYTKQTEMDRFDLKSSGLWVLLSMLGWSMVCVGIFIESKRLISKVLAILGIAIFLIMSVFMIMMILT